VSFVTPERAAAMSALSHKRTHPLQQIASYSITSSASESTLFGTVKFIAFAVFMLMTNR